MDGTGAVIAMRAYCKKHGYNMPAVSYQHYGEATPILTDKVVLMADFSYKREEMISLSKVAKSLTVLDHHASAEKELEGLDFCHFDMAKSGAVLAWEYLMPDEEVPKLLQYIQDRDIWAWKLDNSKEVSAGISLMPFEFWTNEELDVVLSEDTITALETAGKSVLRYQDIQSLKVDRQVKESGESTLFNIAGHKVPCITSTHLISEIGNLISEGRPFSAQYFMTGDSIVFSLRSQPTGEDVSVIAAKYGGGGHPRAAGFSFKFNEINLDILFREQNLDIALEAATALSDPETLMRKILGEIFNGATMTGKQPEQELSVEKDPDAVGFFNRTTIRSMAASMDNSDAPKEKKLPPILAARLKDKKA